MLMLGEKFLKKCYQEAGTIKWAKTRMRTDTTQRSTERRSASQKRGRAKKKKEGRN